jgi:hypothetical protein
LTLRESHRADRVLVSEEGRSVGRYQEQVHSQEECSRCILLSKGMQRISIDDDARRKIQISNTNFERHKIIDHN